MKIFKAIVSAFYPETCSVCGDITEEGEHFCDYCYEMLERTGVDKRCTKCGLPKKQCACSKYIFRFSGCTAPLYYEKYSKTAMYAFKFRRKEGIGKVFAELMALSVNESFYDVDFDLITYVPMRLKNKISRGYNQSEILAEELSGILKIPIAKNLLGCKRKSKAQHKLPHKKRFDNVRDKYFCNRKISGKTVLLVDDIKTTGATLDECSRQLLLSGADKVYCVTGLLTKQDRKRNDK